MTPQMLRSLEELMETGLRGGALWIGPGQAPVTGELPFKLPVSPDQVIQQQTVPPTLQPPGGTRITPAP